MLYPGRFESKVGLDIVRQHLHDLCLSSAGQEYVANIQVESDPNIINLKLDQAEEMRMVQLMEQGFPASEYIDLSSLLYRIRPEGSSLLEEDLMLVRTSLRTLTSLSSFFDEQRIIAYPNLARISAELLDTSSLLKKIDWLIDDRGRIKDKASADLFRIRHDILRLQAQSREKLGVIISNAKRSGWAPPDLDITLRNGRLVIPLFASHKRKIKGFVHDASATEQTVFLEPEEVLDINNEVRELEINEKDEIRRILLHFSDELRSYIPQLIDSYKILGLFDGLRAAALYALSMDAVRPKVSADCFISWTNARHPLLLLNNKKQEKPVVPFNLSLNHEQRILVISGPNAGGKSVCLKTIGLIQCMIQSGLLVPLGENSESGVFRNIFIDIGDEQSIENDLSTYSSHLKNMLFFMENGSSATLFLIDELGSGTEPQAGGAIAETILEHLCDKMAMGAVTTHYANLKLLADRKPGIFNGAMMFDTREMKPLYQLVTGRPGTSFAFEIAGKIGIPDEILNLAIDRAGHSQFDYELLLQKLEQERIDLQKKEIELKVADDFLAEIIEKYERLSTNIEKEKKEILNAAKAEAKKIIDDSNRLIERTIREIRESEADRTTVKSLRQEIDVKKAELSDETNIEQKPEPQISKAPARPRRLEGPIVAGDHVRIIGQRTIASVLGVHDNKAEISGGSIVMKVAIDQLEKIDIGPEKHGGRIDTSTRRIAEDIRQRMLVFTPFIDIRGMRAEEAGSRLESFVDEAVLLNIHELRVLHGKGDGVLRQIVRNYLSMRKESIKFRDEHPDRGGHGITIINLA